MPCVVLTNDLETFIPKLGEPPEVRSSAQMIHFNRNVLGSNGTIKPRHANKVVSLYVDFHVMGYTKFADKIPYCNARHSDCTMLSPVARGNLPPKRTPLRVVIANPKVELTFTFIHSAINNLELLSLNVIPKPNFSRRTHRWIGVDGYDLMPFS